MEFLANNLSELIVLTIVFLVFIITIVVLVLRHFERQSFIKNGYIEEEYTTTDSGGESYTATKWVKNK